MKIDFTFERHGVNIVTFHSNIKDIHITLEYVPEKRKFNAFSDYDITKRFVYHGRNYDRTKQGNREAYLKVLRMVKPFLSKAIKEYFN